MKAFILRAAVTAAFLSIAVVSAQDTTASPSTNTDKHWTQMRENMGKMQVQMEKLGKTSDPKERSKLIQEHMQTMQVNMQTMRGMGGPMMMGGGQSADRMMGGSSKQRQEIMEKRMDMMQMMMEQVLQHEDVARPTPEK